MRSVEEERRPSTGEGGDGAMGMLAAAPRRMGQYRHMATTGGRGNELLGCVSGYGLIVVFAAAAMFFAGADGLEPRSEQGTKCRNTVQGTQFVTDDQGFLCTMDHLDFATGCCKEGEAMGQHTCGMCEEETMCCDQYEICVSCCLSPRNKNLRKDVMSKLASNPTYKKANKEEFEFCRAACRTSSRSTVHGNAYTSESKYCVSAGIASKTLQTPSDLQAVAGSQGQSCDDVCGAKGLRCDARFLSNVNTCEKLTAAFPCKWDMCTENFGHDQPAYVSNPANMEMYGQCLVNSKHQYFSCAGHHADTSRICPCRPDPTKKVVVA